MRQTAEDRRRLESVARLFVVMVAAFLTLVSLIAFTCTGWTVGSNSDAMLLFRHAGALVTPWAAVHFIAHDRYPMAAGLMALAGPFYLWMENGWGFIQPSSGFSVISGMPFAAAGVALLVHLVRLDALSTAGSTRTAGGR